MHAFAVVACTDDGCDGRAVGGILVAAVFATFTWLQHAVDHHTAEVAAEIAVDLTLELWNCVDAIVEDTDEDAFTGPSVIERVERVDVFSSGVVAAVFLIVLRRTDWLLIARGDYVPVRRGDRIAIGLA